MQAVGGGTNFEYVGGYIAYQSHHNYIHDCTFHDYGNFTDDDNGILLNIGHDTLGEEKREANYKVG